MQVEVGLFHTLNALPARKRPGTHRIANLEVSQQVWTQGGSRPVHAVKVYLGSEELLPSFLTSALDGGEWSVAHPIRFTPRERAPSRRLRGPQSRFGRSEKQNILPCRESNCDYPVEMRW